MMQSTSYSVTATTTPATFGAAAQSISFAYDLANTGNVALSSVALSDTRATGLSCPSTAIAYGATVSGWTVNIGDSPTNNGGAGDAATQSRDAESPGARAEALAWAKGK